MIKAACARVRASTPVPELICPALLLARFSIQNKVSITRAVFVTSFVVDDALAFVLRDADFELS